MKFPPIVDCFDHIVTYLGFFCHANSIDNSQGEKGSHLFGGCPKYGMKYPQGNQERYGKIGDMLVFTLLQHIHFGVKCSIHLRAVFFRGEKVPEIGDSGDPIVVPGHGVGLGGVHDVFLLLPGRPLDPEDP